MEIRPLPKELQMKAEQELNEVQGRVEEDLEHIKTWLDKQPHLNVRRDHQWLISFLRGCKFSLQKAKDKLEYFMSARTLLPEIFSNRDPFSPDIQEMLKIGCLFPLPKTEDDLGPRIVYFNTGVCNPHTITLEKVLRLYSMFVDILMLEDDNCVVSGVCYWVNYKDSSLNYVTQYTPTFIKKVIICMQNSYPMRIKGVYCTHAPSILETTFNVIKSVMSTKIRERMFVYSEDNFNKFDVHVSKNIQPAELGGSGGNIPDIAAHWKSKIEGYREWFLEDEQYRSDERKRLGQPRTTADMFGIEGSFRKLEID